MTSIWQETASIPPRPGLNRDVATNTVIIGGGLTGVLLGYQLQQRGIDNIILEAKTIGSGKTKGTTAKITLQHGLKYAQLLKTMGYEKTKIYAQANRDAIEEYLNIISRNNINCSLEEKEACLYSVKEEKDLGMEYRAAKRVGIDCSLNYRSPLPFPVNRVLSFRNQYQFHPLNFLTEVSRELTVYENSPAEKIKGRRVFTPEGSVQAKNIVFASHYPYHDKVGFYFSKLHQERSYVLALEKGQDVEGMYLCVDGNAPSLRNWGDYLIVGGGNHRCGENPQGGKYQALEDIAAKYWNGSTVAAKWSAQDNMALDSIPYIGRYSPFSPHCYTATGYEKWGMTSSMVAAMLLADAIDGRYNIYSELFSPQRFTPAASQKNFWRNAAHSAKDLLRYPFTGADHSFQDFPLNTGKIIKTKAGKVGAYRDKTGKFHLVSPRCPHMGCQLAWNPDEKSWDCPCHGSRFDYQGNIIDNPSHKSIKLER